MTKAIMIQGAGSNVGKSMVVAGLCRVFARRGMEVRPFKPQNMSNNAAVTEDGGEIGRAQALQAMACGVPAHTDMNPVLLKPESDVGAQVIVQGKRYATLKARDYAKAKPDLLSKTLQSFHRLSKAADLIIIEGAGSPAEINLRKGDIANMGFAEAAGVPVVLIGDIDRGGVIAQIVGTHCVLPEKDRARIKAFMINKFRGDVTLFDEGMAEITARTDWAPLGVLPWFADAWQLPAEDVMDISSTSRSGDVIKVVVPKLSRIANFDDLDPLAMEPGVSVEVIEPGRPLPADADLVLLPGSKSTVGDLAFLRAQGWDIDLLAHVRRGGHVLGICGGYQMLGRTISDPEGIEGAQGSVSGLGLLDVDTVMAPLKRLADVEGTHLASGAAVTGYEIHIGTTRGADTLRPWLKMDGADAGATSPDGKVEGCYIHGLFTSDAFRKSYLAKLGGTSAVSDYSGAVNTALDALADHLELHVNVDEFLELAETVEVS
ncbi:cobyric acid synthase [Litoreibacter albidus]|uniref:Cobyric acid synthase n=1 Tax=Litoreibacter albidus TaxID=670155 RepID=A0A1H2RBD7_9RHOB|nr:cobyric acid synthase [Litoreibacter albidus]SDW15989.1 adenosylcobyric acid synthase (glutamine-hydrolysing) [Litoreibacter albidus]